MQPRYLLTVPLGLVLVTGLVACSSDSTSSPATASAETAAPSSTASSDTAAESTDSIAVTPASDTAVAAFTAAMATTADAFLASLSSDQQGTVLYDLDDSALTTGWSNLPIDMVPRNGLALGDMTEAQQASALALIEAALSDQGYAQLEAIRLADTYLGENGQGNLTWGAQYYYVAIFGTPSATDTWRLQIGGHHYAMTLTFQGGVVSTTPEFTGIEPTSFTSGGATVEAMSHESAALFGLFATLDDTQLAAARLSGAYDDVLVGPGNDGEFPATEGLAVSELSAAQQQAVVDAVMAWAGDVDGAVAAVARAKVEAELDQTYISWSSSVDPTQQGAYARIDGPSVWIEMIAQGGIGFAGVHYHSIYRDKTSDYGSV